MPVKVFVKNKSRDGSDRKAPAPIGNTMFVKRGRLARNVELPEIELSLYPIAIVSLFPVENHDAGNTTVIVHWPVVDEEEQDPVTAEPANDTGTIETTTDEEDV